MRVEKLVCQSMLLGGLLGVGGCQLKPHRPPLPPAEPEAPREVIADLPLVHVPTAEVLREPSPPGPLPSETGGVDLSQTYERMPPEIIQRVVRAHFGSFRLCYAKSLRSSPNLQGRVKVTFLIEPDGRVSSAVGEGDIPSLEVSDCVAGAFEELRFPKCSQRTTVTYPVVFTPTG